MQSEQNVKRFKRQKSLKHGFNIPTNLRREAIDVTNAFELKGKLACFLQNVIGIVITLILVLFEERVKPKYDGKVLKREKRELSWSRVENQQQTQPTSEPNPGNIGGK